MKVILGLIAASVFSVTMATPAAPASLLGGLINTGSDSGNGSGLISNNSNGSLGVGGSNGVSVNLGGLGGGLGGSGSTGVPGVADISTGQSSGGGTTLGASLLGGGGTTLGLNPLGLFGNSGGLNVSLPGFGGGNGGPGTPGAPGAPGANGYGGYNGYNGQNGGVYIGTNVSSRLRSILAMLAQRNWIRMVNGRAICLGYFGTAEISSVLPAKDWANLNAALPQYAQDIATLRQLLANCRTPQQRQALNVRDLNRVIGIGVGQGGVPVVYML